MCSNFFKRQWWRRLRGWTRVSSRPNGILVILLLLLHQTYNHALRESANEKNLNYSDFSRHIFRNLTGGNNTRAAMESSAVVHSIRFRDFEPRTPNEQTWLAPTWRREAESNKYMLNSDENGGDIKKGVLEQRRPRGIHFEADGRDLSVNLEFIIPFLQIPIARSIQLTQSAFRKLADLNSRTLLIGGAFAVVGALIAAAVKAVKAVTSPTFYGYGYKKRTRAADLMDGLTFVSYGPETEGGVAMTKSVDRAQDVFNILEGNLQAHDINLSACAQRAICRYVQLATASVQTERGSPTERIIDGIINLNILKDYLNGTALQKAITVGRKSNDTTCEQVFRDCKWSKTQSTAWKTAMDFFWQLL